MSFNGIPDLDPCLIQTINITAGLRYVISFDVTTASIGMAIFLGGNLVTANVFATGTNVIPYAIAGENGTISFQGTNVAGSIDNVSIQLAVPSNQFTLSKSSGLVYCNYIDINNSNATGGAIWRAGRNSIDGWNNDGWSFDALSIPQNYRLSPTPSGGGGPSEQNARMFQEEITGEISITV
jgi:hypothetical protein